ncbi:hypothetical protein EVAR_55440_1 [Eumeta japonica]|uniref:Uncharacterized protein n=1 Tax=Eumeta variegata TaxID=151549 RepID=A0A4C1Y1L6_EUMVA|nr:hypothetical protein EVAR_55440_1 [Eumeta japonica]
MRLKENLVLSSSSSSSRSTWLRYDMETMGRLNCASTSSGGPPSSIIALSLPSPYIPFINPLPLQHPTNLKYPISTQVVKPLVRDAVGPMVSGQRYTLNQRGGLNKSLSTEDKIGCPRVLVLKLHTRRSRRSYDFRKIRRSRFRETARPPPPGPDPGNRCSESKQYLAMHRTSKCCCLRFSAEFA